GEHGGDEQDGLAPHGPHSRRGRAGPALSRPWSTVPPARTCNRAAFRGEDMTDRGSRVVALVGACALVALAACGKKEQLAPSTAPAQTAPSAAPVTQPPPPTTAPTPPPVWRAARWGMTRDEVLAAFPGEAQRLAPPAPFAQPQPGSSLAAGAGDLAIPAYDADGASFRVLFGFQAKALDRIHFSALKPGASTCEDLEKALTDRHGKPAR